VKVRTRREPQYVVVEVMDLGPGILPEETVHIFDLFGQGVRGLDRATGGLGIGLHLVKRISELHGAHVGVNSQPGGGSTFWVRLPLALADEARHTAEVAATEAAAAGEMPPERKAA
jgi:signal transduction histidine kinase